MSQRLFEQRRRAGAWQRWRWRVLALVLLVLAVVLAWLVWFSDVLGVRDVDVRGVDSFPVRSVLDAADVRTGSPLARLDADAIEERVAALPRVASVEVRRDWPHGVVIDVTERVAVLWTRTDEGTIRALDADGVAFRTFRRAPKGLLEATSTETEERPRRRALSAAAQVLADVKRRAPDLYERVARVQVDTRDDVRLLLHGRRTLVWGSPGETTAKLRVVDKLLELRASVYDVSAPDTPTTS